MEQQIVLPEINSDPCLVCGKLTSKLHLQIQICYSCSIFYRRSVNADKKYVCQTGSNKCDIKSRRKPMCKVCRYNRCLELNLNINKTHQNIPIFQLSFKTDDSDPWNVVDLFYQIHSTFKHISKFTRTDSFSYFNDAVTNLLKSSQSTDKWRPSESMFIRANFANKFSLNTAKLLANYPSFQNLPYNEKVIIHDRFWQMLMNLRNNYLTYIYFNNESKYKRIVDNYQYIDIVLQNSNKVTGINFDLESTKLFILPCVQKWNKFFEDLIKLKPTLFEFNYICLLSLWSFHSLPDLSDATHKLGEEMIAEASIKLHEYYTNELRIQNYAARQAKLFNIAKRVEEVVQAKQEMLKAWHFFNFGPNAFTFCKFETNYFVYKNT